MSFIEPDPVCEGCGKTIPYAFFHEHLNACQRWHMKKVIAKKNQRKPKHARVV